MSGHTPTPWRVILSDNATPHITHAEGPDFTDISDNSNVVCVMPAEVITSFNSGANAAFIVKAVNAHEALVEALELSNKGLHKLNDVLNREMVNQIPLHVFEKVGDGLTAGDAALAQAKGGDQ